MSSSSRWILISAGEHSGDRIAAAVVRAIRHHRPKLRFFGAGGPGMEAAGVEVRHHVSALSVTGIVEALDRAGGALRLLGDLALQIRRRRVGLGLLVDYPGLNLRLADLMGLCGIPVLYLVAPQRWAWLGFRTRALRRLDRLAVTLPFEESWFRSRGIQASYVGNPVLDLFRPTPPQTARRSLGLAEDGPIIAVMPGSRPNEIRQHMPVLLEALRLIPDAQAVIATVDSAGEALCHQLAPHLPRADASVALGAARVGLCASGTATLEAAVAGVPSVVFYRMSPLTFALARRLVRVPHISLPNLILGRTVLPELIQHEMRPRRIAREVRRMLDPAVGQEIRRDLRQVVFRLGRPGMAGRVAKLALELL